MDLLRTVCEDAVGSFKDPLSTKENINGATAYKWKCLQNLLSITRNINSLKISESDKKKLLRDYICINLTSYC